MESLRKKTIRELDKQIEELENQKKALERDEVVPAILYLWTSKPVCLDDIRYRSDLETVKQQISKDLDKAWVKRWGNIGPTRTFERD